MTSAYDHSVAAVILAPAHDELDRRVLRTIEAYTEAGIKSILFLERERVVDIGKSNSRERIKTYSKIHILKLAFGRIGKENAELKKFIEDARCVHIHDSGLYGLFLTKFVFRINKKCKIIFDYHDWIEWEIPYQISKFVKTTAITKIISKTLLNLIYIYFSGIKIDAIVGISAGQTRHIIKKLCLNQGINSLTVPNTRSMQASIANPDHSSSAQINIIWVGNIGAGRSIEDNFKMIFNRIESSENKANIRLYTIGKKWGDFSDDFEKSLMHLGGYEDDEDLIEMAPVGKNIGIFFGWDDVWDTGINRIASPNKLYSYIQLEWPFLLPHTLEEFISSANVPQEFVYHNSSEIVDKAVQISENYMYCVSLVKNIKTSIRTDKECVDDLVQLFKI